MDNITERAVALAGILQACKEVQSLARKGTNDSLTYDSCVKSILVLDAVNTVAVYGGVDGIRAGLRMMVEGVMHSAAPEDVEVLRYTMSILQLQNQLYKDSKRFSQFAQDVERLSAKSEDELVDACSEIYQKYVSPMQPQIIVQGEEKHLQQVEVPPKIRTLLLSALRSAVLWQQKGGGRFRLIWERTRMQNAARSLLARG